MPAAEEDHEPEWTRVAVPPSWRHGTSPRETLEKETRTLPRTLALGPAKHGSRRVSAEATKENELQQLWPCHGRHAGVVRAPSLALAPSRPPFPHACSQELGRPIARRAFAAHCCCPALSACCAASQVAFRRRRRHHHPRARRRW